MHRTLAAATRMDAVRPPIVPVIGALIRQVPGTISLGQGVVHYGPPPAALAAVRDALADPETHQYQDGAGIPDLVTTIGAKLRAENHIDVARGSTILVTAGANMAFAHAVLAITTPGDEVILPVPFYFNHEMAVQMAGCRAVPVATDSSYQLDVDAIGRAITSRTRAVVTITPNNPTGAVYPDTTLRALNTMCRDRGLYHISDEPYEYFTYDAARHVSPGGFPGASDHTLSIYSLSKAYGFAGWRIGYMAYPSHLAPAMMKSQDTILICPPVASQLGAGAAMAVGRAYCAPFVRELAAIRGIVIARLGALAPLATVPAADGAFYCFMKIETVMDSMTLADRLIREHKVAVIPGSAFGMTNGCYLRVAYGALQRATVEEGLGRLVGGLKTILG